MYATVNMKVNFHILNQDQAINLISPSKLKGANILQVFIGTILTFQVLKR